ARHRQAMRSRRASRRGCRARSARPRAARRRRLHRPPSTPRPLAGSRCSPRRSARRHWRERFQPAAARPPAEAAAAQAFPARAPSPQYLPSRGAVLVVLELDAHRLELIADAIGFLEILRLTSSISSITQAQYHLLVHVPMQRERRTFLSNITKRIDS